MGGEHITHVVRSVREKSPEPALVQIGETDAGRFAQRLQPASRSSCRSIERRLDLAPQPASIFLAHLRSHANRQALAVAPT